jgi:hypothetical protein
MASRPPIHQSAKAGLTIRTPVPSGPEIAALNVSRRVKAKTQHLVVCSVSRSQHLVDFPPSSVDGRWTTRGIRVAALLLCPRAAPGPVRAWRRRARSPVPRERK